jgi:5-methylcytosine-specific restriction enzyme subunit McrC
VIAQSTAKSLGNRLDIREGYAGLEISSTSFVGRVDIGPLRVAIRPKLPTMPLATLLRYAYGLRDLTTFEETVTPTISSGLQDLLISMLGSEIEELLYRGLTRQYIALEKRLGSPRGRLLLAEVAKRGGVTEARLPCRYFDRDMDWHLNQVLRNGLATAAFMTEDRDLRRRTLKLEEMFRDVRRQPRFNYRERERAQKNITRLTAASASALTIIQLLDELQGTEFVQTTQQSKTPGFLFDMNRFFQKLLARFLADNLANAEIREEWTISTILVYAADSNPRLQKVRPRPDYALFQETKLRGFLDAKYRDVWESGLPPEWLYQLSIYALASPSKVSVLLYATMSQNARDECVEIRSNDGIALIILRPVSLPMLACLVADAHPGALLEDRRHLASELISLQPRSR